MLGLVALEPKIKKEFIEAKDEQGNTPLLSAVACQNFEAIPLLLAAGADVLAKNDKAQSVITIAPLNTFPQETLKFFLKRIKLIIRNIIVADDCTLSLVEKS